MEELMQVTYTEQDMDRWIKICMRLIEKFRGQLQAEYGSDIYSAIKMFDKLYEEQNAEMPLMWYEYCAAGFEEHL